MRRNALRLAVALIATTVLTACADFATGPEAPRAPRFDTVTDSTIEHGYDGNHQGGST
jgi:hypothetical protein